MKQHILNNANEFTGDILCLDEQGNKLGQLSAEEALIKAEELSLDAVVISKSPDVVKIMDFGKFKYQQEKKEKLNKKNHKKVEDKEIQFSLNIAVHDFNIKIKRAATFLEKKNRVHFRLRLKGRENDRPEEGIKIMKNAIEQLKDIDGAKVMGEPVRTGNTIQMVMVAA